MKLLKFFMLSFVICMAQVACSGGKMNYSDSTPISYDVQIPSLVLHAHKYNFTVVTEPNVICHAGVAFWDKKNRWTIDELPNMKADDTGICKWDWEIPSNAKNGTGEFRGYVENGERKTNFFPETFCIEICP